MELWQQLLEKSVNTPAGFARHFPELNLPEIQKVMEKYPARINPYYLKLAKRNPALYKQAIPDINELNESICVEDPLAEEEHSPVPNLTHRYPDRCLLLVSHQCAMYCRFCTRKRKVGDPLVINSDTISDGIKYIKKQKNIRDVILSGGDPFLLIDEVLEEIIVKIRAIKHVQIIRIGTRVPCVLPHRITDNLLNMLKKYQPIFINTHFNHPDEITSESIAACEKIVNAGFPLNNQSVLLKGVNDNVDVLTELFHKLLMIRVRPYYLYQADITRGTDHFRTKVETGLKIMGGIRGYTSGLAVPYYVIDAPGGGGKIPVLPEYLIKRNSKELLLRNYEGQIFKYPEAQQKIVRKVKSNMKK